VKCFLFISIILEHIDTVVPSWHTSIKALVVDKTFWYSHLFVTNHIHFLIIVFLQQPKHSIDIGIYITIKHDQFLIIS